MMIFLHLVFRSIIALIFLPILPLSACICIPPLIMFSIFRIHWSIPFPELESVNTAGIPFFSKYCIHNWFCFSSAKSHLFSIIIFFFPFVIFAMSGFWLDIGILASNNSITMSTIFNYASNFLLVFAMWPGYQLILTFGNFSSLLFIYITSSF